MWQDVIKFATKAIKKSDTEKEIAIYIKNKFDEKYKPTWHCIVGTDFGSCVSYEIDHFFILMF